MPVILTTSVALALLVGFASALVGFNQARQERDRAMQAEAASKAVLGFFQEKVLAAARPEGFYGGLGPGVTVRAAVESAEPAVAMAFTNHPLVEAGIRLVLGESYGYLGDHGRAVRQHERARSLRVAQLGSDHLETLNSMHFLARAYDAEGRSREALPLLEEIVKQYRARLDPNHPDTLGAIDSLATAYQHAGRIGDSLPLFEEVINVKKAQLGPDHMETLVSMNNLAVAYAEAGRRKEAQAHLEDTLKGLNTRLGPDHFNTLSTMINLALSYWEAGRKQKALSLFEEAFRLQRMKLGPEHPSTLDTLKYLASVYAELGYWTNAVEQYQALMGARPTNHMFWFQAGAAAAVAGQTEVSGAIWEGMAARFGTNQDERVRQLLARSLALAPASPTNLALVLKLVDGLVVQRPESLGNQTIQGLVEYRAGHWAEAAKRLDPSWKHWESRRGCVAGYFMAMALHQLGDTAAARTLLDQVNQRLAGVLHRGYFGDSWPDSAHNLVARAEAERLILGREMSLPVTAESLSAARQAWETVAQSLEAVDSLARDMKWDQARDGCLKILISPTFNLATAEYKEGTTSMRFALTYVMAGDQAGYRNWCRSLLDQRYCVGTSVAQESRAKSCLLVGGLIPGEVSAQAYALMKETVKPETLKDSDYWNWLDWGMAVYRRGDFADAEKALLRAAKSKEPECVAGAMAYRAMALYRLGRVAEATSAFQEAETKLENLLKNRATARWWDLDVGRLALSEARELLGQTGRK